MTTKLDAANHFADIATGFLALVSSPAESPDVFARRLLESLSQLYSAALAMPEADCGAESIDFSATNEKERKRVYSVVSNALGERDQYWFVFNPEFAGDIAPDPDRGLLSDDCADIYSELAGPLKAFRKGRLDLLDEIIWEWSAVPFESHWEIHASHAINALHWIVFKQGPAGP